MQKKYKAKFKKSNIKTPNKKIHIKKIKNLILKKIPNTNNITK